MIARRLRTCCRARSAPHPTPFQYVMIAVMLVGHHRGRDRGVLPRRATSPTVSSSCCCSAMMVVKFILVASWFMHLRTDQPVFRRFFILGRDRRDRALPRSCWRRCTASRRTERRPLMLGAVALPRVDAPSRRLVARRGCSAAGYAIAIVRLGPTLGAAGPGGRHPLPGRRAGRSASLAMWLAVRLADPRRRRAVQLQRPHGAAPHVLDAGRAAAAARARRPGCCAGAAAAGRLFRTVRALARFLPALVIFNVVLVLHALARRW